MRNDINHAMESAESLIEQCDWSLHGDRDVPRGWSADHLKAQIRRMRTHLVELRDELYGIGCCLESQPQHDTAP